MARRKQGSNTTGPAGRNKGTEKVIHVVFGPGGGRVDPSSSPSGAAGLNGGGSSSDSGGGRGAGNKHGQLNVPEPPPSREPVSDVFTSSEVARLLGLTVGRVRSLAKSGIIAPSGRRKGHRAYTFQDLISLRVARDLLKKKVRLKDVARAVESLRKALPKVTRPLSELSVTSDGKSMVVRTQSGPDFEPATGQMVLDFQIKSLRDDVVRVLRPNAGRERARTAYDVYVKASQLDEDPATILEAEELYRHAIELDPWLAIAYTNLGNIAFRRADEDAAMALYEKALQIDSAQPEAQYNVGYVMLERGHPERAIGYFEGAIKSDPRFADAYFNLAMAFEQTGDPQSARPCWRKYLDLEPTGTWSDIARKHL